MAHTTLQNECESEKPAHLVDTRTLDTLSADIQILASRISAVAGAAHEAVDYSEPDEVKRKPLDRTSRFIEIIEEAAEAIAAKGEAIEELAFDARRVPSGQDN